MADEDYLGAEFFQGLEGRITVGKGETNLFNPLQGHGRPQGGFNDVDIEAHPLSKIGGSLAPEADLDDQEALAMLQEINQAPIP